MITKKKDRPFLLNENGLAYYNYFNKMFLNKVETSKSSLGES